MMHVWRQEGFGDFRRGTCGNAGQNLYVSKAGILQRIHHWDTTGNGVLDLVFCNSQDHFEQVPAYLYPRPLSDAEPICLPSDGAMTGTVADLTGDGYEDLVLGMWHNGVHQQLNALVYFGGPDGFGEHRTLALPVPMCLSVAAGDFNGDGLTDLAFLRRGGLRMFLRSELGFEPKRFKDVEISGAQIAAGDLDRDGFADLVAGSAEGEWTIYWGGPEGIVPERATSVAGVPSRTLVQGDDENGQQGYAEFVADAVPLPAVLEIGGVPHLFLPGTGSFFLVPVLPGREFGPPLEFPVQRAMAAALGDVDGDGWDDLVVVGRGISAGEGQSWVFWGDENGFSPRRRSPISSQAACDVAVADFDGDGCADILICQSRRRDTFTRSSLIYRGSRERCLRSPTELQSHDARRVFAVRGPVGELPQAAIVNHFSRGALGDVSVSIFPGGADGYRAERVMRVPGWGAVEALRPDLDDDGLPDLVLANCSENSVDLDPGSYIYLNTPTGFGDRPDVKLPTTRAHGVCCADLDRDGYLDLVFGGFRNPELLVFHGGAGGFLEREPERIHLYVDGETYEESRWIYLADLNNDGWLDLFVPQILSDRSLILWGGPGGFSMDRVQVLSVERAACARAADLSGNGYLDLIVGGHNPTVGSPHDSFVYIYWNGPDGLSQDRRAMLPACGINALCVADFNNDGLLDLFVGSYHKGVERDVDSFVYWNRPGRGFSQADRQRLFTHSASGCFAADLNGNGWQDLVVANHKVWGDHVGYSEIWWNGPTGFHADRTTRLPTAGPHGISAVEPGNIVDRGPEEYYESCVHQLPAPAHVQRVSWDAETPAPTYVRAQVRAGDTEADVLAAPWTGPRGPGTWFTERIPAPETSIRGRWLQYRLALGAPNSCGTPRVSAVEIVCAW